MTLRTWHLETLFVATVLVVVAISTGTKPAEWLGTLAVLASFGHASISSRLAESEAVRAKPSVPCYRKAVLYFIAKEAFWTAYFIEKRAWSALVGCAVFLAHPLWRAARRRRHPLTPSEDS